jgi:hypothetical protein
MESVHGAFTNERDVSFLLVCNFRYRCTYDVGAKSILDLATQFASGCAASASASCHKTHAQPGDVVWRDDTDGHIDIACIIAHLLFYIGPSGAVFHASFFVAGRYQLSAPAWLPVALDLSQSSRFF